MAGSYIVNVPKLKGRENYDEWAFAAQNFLILEGVDISEVPMPSASTSSSSTKETVETKSVRIDAQKAKAKLIMTIDSALYVHIKNEKTVQDVWKRLKILFDDSGFTRRINLLRQLISIRLEDCESMTSYVTQMVDTAQKLQGTGFQITDEWVGSLLLAGLPEKFSPMIMAVEHSGMAISTDVIKSKLLDMSTEHGKTESAFLSKGWQQRKKGADLSKVTARTSSKPMKTIRCFRCKQVGHYRNQCNYTKENEKEIVFSAFALDTTFKKENWYVDSGASAHMIANQKQLTNVSHKPSIKEIVVANQQTVPVLCSGQTQITTVVEGSEYEITVENVLCIPNLTTNLLSVSQLIQKGNKVTFEKGVCEIRNRQNVLVGKAVLVNGVYKLDIKSESVFAGSATTTTSQLWHRRLGHINSKNLTSMMNGAVDGISYCDKAEIDKTKCEVCCEGKMARLPFSHKGTRSENVLELVHADVCGPMETASVGSSKYFLLFVDDYSRMTFVFFLKMKSEVMKYFRDFKTLVERQKGKKIKILRTDNGGEFCSSDMSSFLKKAGITHQKTNPYTPEQNGLCERMNRTVVERARCLLFDAKMDKKFWAEAVNTAVYLRNRTLASGLSKTPYELWSGKKPDVSHIRVFGSTAMVHVPKQKRAKWDRKAEKHILLGYAENTKGYRLYNPITNDIITSRDVVVMEDSSDFERSDTVQAVIEEQTNKPREHCASKTLDSEPIKTLEEPSISESDSTYIAEDISTSSSDEFYDVVKDRETKDLEPAERTVSEKRERRKPVRYGYCVCIPKNNEETNYSGCPAHNLTYEEVMSGAERNEWCAAMDEELQSFHDSDAWEVVDKPSDGTVVQCKWVYKKKLTSDNKVKYRARLVAKGFTQKEGIDYKETFSPVLKYSTLRLLFALCVQLDLSITHLDVTTAFLNGHLNETVYMYLPQNFHCNDKSNKVLKLKKAIYGLKQSARAWYQKVDSRLLELGYKRSMYEPCLYTKPSECNKTFIGLFVDDFFVFSNCVEEVNYLKSQLSTTIKLKDLGKLKQCLGMNVKIEKNRISIDQTKFIESLLCKFNMEKSKGAETPMEVNLKLEKVEGCVNNKYPYQELIGSLMYLSVLTRPDISYCVSYLSQFNNCYSETHWKHAKRVLRYLKCTKTLGLIYVKDNHDIVGFADADWASDVVDRKSYTGYFFKFSGCVVSHECKKQQTVALSSTEAEYMSISEASKEAIFLKNLLSELIYRDNVPILLNNDNQSAQKLCENSMYHKRSKHIDARYHFIREAVANNLVKINYLKTSDMPADILTKSLCKVKHVNFVKELGLAKT